MSRIWIDEADLAGLILERVRQNRWVVLQPETASRVASALIHQSTLPTRDDVTRLICGIRCVQLCATCMMKANAICAAYGSRVDRSEGE